MANLIIKPNSATGDKLILQDRDGGAVLTTADSGITSIKFNPTATGSAPSGAEGAIFYDTTKNALMQYDGTTWVTISDGPTTGGVVTTYGSYKVHSFLTSGWFVAGTDLTCAVLVVAGGGGGGGGAGGSAHVGGGGGAGGMVTSASLSVPAGRYQVIVGNGGIGGVWSGHWDVGCYPGEKGENSSFHTLIAEGGGSGGSESNWGYLSNTMGAIGAGGFGGSGGGGGGTGKGGGTIPTGQGYRGDVGSGATGGGGGGASASSPGSRIGGAGATNDYRTGSNVTYAGGGGGGVDNGPAQTSAAGGAGGGGQGGSKTGPQCTVGTANSGGGGGAGGGNSGGCTGGSGIVVIRYTA